MKREIGKIMHSVRYNESPSISNDYFIVRNVISYNLRRETNFIIPFSRSTALNRHPIIEFTKIWNNLPEDIKNISDKQTFLISITKHLFSYFHENTYNCTIKNCKICNFESFQKRLRLFLEKNKKIDKYPIVYF